MATDQKQTETKAAAPKAEAPAASLLPAAESSDPQVHKLLADRQGHVQTASIELDPTVEENKKAALAQIDEIDKQLADLGYTAK